MIEAVIILAILLVFVLIVQKQVSFSAFNNNRNYEISFTIMDHSMIGTGTFTNSYNQNIDFDDIINVFTKYLDLENVLPFLDPDSVLCMQNEEIEFSPEFIQDFKYSVRVSIKSKENPKDTYYIVYYPNAERDFNVDVRNAIAKAVNDIRHLGQSTLESPYISDDDD